MTASPRFRHGESRFSTRRVPVPATESPDSEHGESRFSTRREGDLGTAGGLAERQAALVAALVAGAPDPPGFDPARLAATRRALLRKRAGEAAKHWPVLAGSLGPRWSTTFAAHHSCHEPGGGLRDGWDLARALRRELTADAAAELREREAFWRYDGVEPPRPRRFGRLRHSLDRLLTAG
jgi:hypothetical protein